MVRYTRDDVTKAEAGGLPPEGVYLAEVVKDGTEQRKSSNTGDPMFNVAFKDVNTGDFLCYDSIMLAGRGLGIGHKKLVMLGVVDPDAPDWEVDAFDLIGKRAVVIEEVTGSGGLVKLAGEVWSAPAYDENQVIAPGTPVDVMEIEGATAIVYPRDQLP